MRGLLDEHSTALTGIFGITPASASRTGTEGPSRFPTSGVFAIYSGTVPVEITGADDSRYRHSRNGNRELNSAIRSVALIQIRPNSSPEHAYCLRNTQA
ncbi:transposase [Citricoccus sp. CH26A]|uniref:transposase n=1 Tax=Citricoccus TaxID=169133 RepID=UPI0009FC5883